MTLLLQYGYQDSFILLTSDTAKRKKYFDVMELEETGRYGELVETREKLFKVSDYVYGTVGGLMSLANLYKNKLLERVKPEDRLEDCERHLSTIIEEVKGEDNSRFYDKFNESGEYVLTLMGYYSDLTSGLVAIEKGNMEKMTTDMTGGLLANMFAPSRDLFEMKDYIINVPEELWKDSDLLNAALTHFANVQAAISQTHPDFVTPTMMYKGFVKQDDILHPFEGEIDLKGLISDMAKGLDESDAK